MAQCLRRPGILPSRFQFFKHLQQRPFSIVSSQWAMSQEMVGQQPRQQSERSVKVTTRELGKMPTDLGLIPQTLIYPTRANRPSLFKEPRALVKLNWLWLKRRINGVMALFVYKMSNKPRLKLHSRQVAPTAVGLHRQMYAAFAEGDVRVLDQICCDGLQESFRGRISSRPRRERWQWELVKYTKRAKVMSHRAVLLGINEMGLRQAVVRIASRQRLTRFTPDGTVVPGSGTEKDTVEYLVIQKKLEKAVEGEWMIWGTMEETSLEMLENEERVDSPKESR